MPGPVERAGGGSVARPEPADLPRPGGARVGDAAGEPAPAAGDELAAPAGHGTSRDATAGGGGEAGPPPAGARSPSGTWAERARSLGTDRYLILCAVVLALMVSFTVKGKWGGGIDIWEHSAAARELADNPLGPRHPMLDVDRPHQFLNPYTLGVGLVSRFTGMSVVTALNLAGLFNLVLIFVGLRLFVRRVTGRKGVEFWALLFVLTLWGPGAWFFSGFLHFNVIALVMTYPATFCKGVVLLALVAHMSYLRDNNPRWLAAVVGASAVVVVCHPVDAVFLWIGMAALSGTADTPRRDRTIALTLAAAAGSFVLALLWPYFSVAQLLFGESTQPFRDAISAGDRDMYHQPLVRLFPLLVVLPFAAYRLRRWRSDPLALMFGGTLLAYGFGYAIENHSFGRLISNAALVGAIILAEEVVKTIETAGSLGPAGRPARNFAVFTSCALVAIGLYSVRNGFEVLPDRYVADLPYELIHNEVDLVPISAYDFVAENAGTYPLAISDVYTAMAIPTFGPKVLAYARFQAFVDMDERGADQQRFFDLGTSEDDRREIIRKHGVALVVLTTRSLESEPVARDIAQLGPAVESNDRFVFVDVRQVLAGGSSGGGQASTPR